MYIALMPETSSQRAALRQAAEALWHPSSYTYCFASEMLNLLSRLQGYCSDTDCQQFPVAIGEFGSRFKLAEDLAHLQDFTKWLNAEGAAADGLHNL